MLNQSRREFARFVFVGMLNTLLGYSVVWIAYNLLNLSYWLSSAVAYVGLMPVNYILHKRITFQKRGKSTLKEAISFVANILICYLLAYKIAVLVVDYALWNIFAVESQKMIENIALIVGNIFFALFNFLGQKIMVFRKRNWN